MCLRGCEAQISSQNSDTKIQSTNFTFTFIIESIFFNYSEHGKDLLIHNMGASSPHSLAVILFL